MTTPPDPRPIVVKVGGSTLGALDTSLSDIASAAMAGQRICVVHGGGATISEWLELAGIEPKFARGLRVTDAATLDVVVAVLGGLVNKRIVAELAQRGARAAGISGADGSMLAAEAYDEDLGFVGRIGKADPALPLELMSGGYLPVIAPIGIAASGQLLNINADTAAGEIAAALQAERLVFLTDVPGVLDAEKKLIARLTAAEARALIASGVAAGGMIPKIEAAARAAEAGCTTSIIDGTQQGALKRLLGGEALGTAIVP